MLTGMVAPQMKVGIDLNDRMHLERVQLCNMELGTACVGAAAGPLLQGGPVVDREEEGGSEHQHPQYTNKSYQLFF